ncbi:hypothetical protein ACIBL8_04545 [Streptomyces sp. NPDC050523]|uniref:hypothetical protein n=1 Tax=Streptomyces sp. NPDC050523 TaxID=3365622 RepID=UPI00379E76C9
MLAQPTALVVGNASTPEALDALRGLAHDVADRLRYPARIAVGRDYDVTEYETVILARDFAEAYDSAVLGCEALSADVCTLWDTDVDGYAYSLRCEHCGEDDTDARPGSPATRGASRRAPAASRRTPDSSAPECSRSPCDYIL